MQVTKELAHVMRDENLFIHEVHPTDVPGQFISELTIDGKHPYLYENLAIANHVSGTTIMEASRQMLKAMSHLFYDVPVQYRFTMRKLHMDFSRWAKLSVPVQMVLDAQTRASTVRGKPCLTFHGQMTYYQEGRMIGIMTGVFTAFDREVEDFLMNRQFAQPPLTKAPTGSHPLAIETPIDLGRAPAPEMKSKSQSKLTSP
jgi:hypothetical protein